MIKQFEITFGKGTDPWYEKAERWAKKKFNNPFIQHLVLGFIEWLKQKWIDVKVQNTMKNIDLQADNIKKIWEEEDKPKEIKIKQVGKFGDKDWSISIGNVNE